MPSAGLSTYSQETVPGDPWFYLYQAVCCIFQNHPYLVGPLASLRTLELLQLCQLPELRSLALLRTHPWMRQLRGLGSFTNYNKYTNPKLIYIFSLAIIYIVYIHMHIYIYIHSQSLIYFGYSLIRLIMPYIYIFFSNGHHYIPWGREASPGCC